MLKRVQIGTMLLAVLLWPTGMVHARGIPIGQQAAPPVSSSPGDMVIEQNVVRVVLDVVVRNAKHKLDMHLLQNDFLAKEDGVPQRVLSFEKHDFLSGPDYVPPKMPPLPPNTFVDVPPGPEWGPLNVILYDALNTGMDDQMIGRAQLLKFIQEIPAGERFAIFILYNHLQLLHGFTSDKAQLLAAVNSRSTWPKVDADYGNTLQGLLDLAHFLDGLPGRKNLIWLSDSFPSASFASDYMAVNPGRSACRLRPPPDPAYLNEIKGITNILTHARIAVYPVDLRGVQGGYCALLQYMDMDEFAGSTGGRAFYSRNDLKTAIGEAANEGSTYYTLTYAPTNKRYDGKLRKIEVSVAEPGYTLAYRRSYFSTPTVPRAEDHDPSPLVDTLLAHMDDGAPMAHDILFSAHIQTSNVGTRTPKDQRIMVNGVESTHYLIDYTVPISQFRSDEKSNLSPQPLEFAVAAFDADGVTLNSLVQQSSDEMSTLQPPFPKRSNYLIEQQIDVPRNATTLRVAVRNRQTKQVGTLEVALPLARE